MTLESVLGKMLVDLMGQHPNGNHPTPSPTSIPPTSMPSTPTETGGSEAVAMLQIVLATMERMQERTQRETRELVVTILQGRELTPQEREELIQPSRTSFDPPDYDDPGTEDLPSGIQAVFEREQAEQDEVRSLRTEQEILARQRAEAREQLANLESPIGSEVSWLRDSPADLG